MTGWSFSAVAPETVRAFAAAKGEELLRATQPARLRAREVFERIVEPALVASDLEDLERRLDPRQHAIHQSLLSRLFVVPSDALRAESEAAVAAFILHGDEELIRYGQLSIAPARTPLEIIRQGRSTPTAVIQQLCLLIDRILIYRALR